MATPRSSGSRTVPRTSESGQSEERDLSANNRDTKVWVVNRDLAVWEAMTNMRQKLACLPHLNRNNPRHRAAIREAEERNRLVMPFSRANRVRQAVKELDKAERNDQYRESLRALAGEIPVPANWRETVTYLPWFDHDKHYRIQWTKTCQNFADAERNAADAARVQAEAEAQPSPSPPTTPVTVDPLPVPPPAEGSTSSHTSEVCSIKRFVVF